VNKNITQLANKDNLDKTQKNYLSSLIQTLHEMTNRVIDKIKEFRRQCPLFDQNFIIHNQV